MASETIDPARIVEALRKNVESWSPSVEREEVGRVIETGDGIARVSGLPSAMANELLEFPGGLFGLAFNLDEDEIGCILFGEGSGIEEGDPVKQTGTVLSVPVGDGFLGRVVDGLGRPLDDLGPDPAEATRALELQAPNVVSRQPVKEPLYTGITAIDSMTAIGRGQRAADHRRPADRQDRRRARHDHQPEAVLGDAAGREVHLRRDRAEGVDGRGGGRHAPRERRARVHGGGQRERGRPGAVPVRRPVRRRRDRRRTGCTRATTC